MRQFSNQTRPVAGAEGARAFGGLGFDLAPVAKVARCLTMTWEGAPSVDQPLQPEAAFIPCSAGYTLLVSLGREIRGR